MSHRPVEDKEYYEALRPAGLEVAEITLRQDYQTLLENDLPVAGTVRGMIIVQALQQSNEVVS